MTWARMYPRKARFEATCPRCQQVIQVGQKIGWKPGQAAEHWACCVGGVKRAARAELDTARAALDTRRSFERRWTTGSGQRSFSERAKQDWEAMRRARQQT